MQIGKLTRKVCLLVIPEQQEELRATQSRRPTICYIAVVIRLNQVSLNQVSLNRVASNRVAVGARPCLARSTISRSVFLFPRNSYFGFLCMVLCKFCDVGCAVAESQFFRVGFQCKNQALFEVFTKFHLRFFCHDFSEFKKFGTNTQVHIQLSFRFSATTAGSGALS